MNLINLTEPPAGKTGWPWTEGTTAPAPQSSSSWPKVTVVTPSFNQGQFLEETIRSVLLQNYPNLEYIIIDGGSNDNSVAIIRKYEAHLKYWVSEKDNGQTHAINKGFRMATGEWVGWLNSDDFYLPGALITLLHEVRETPFKWVAGSVKYIHEGNERRDSIEKQNSSAKLIDWLLFKFYFNQPGALWKRSLFKQYGYLEEHMHYAFDWAFWCCLVAHGVQPLLIEEPVAAFRLHDESKTCTRWDRFCAENYAIIQGYLPQLSASDKKAAAKHQTNLLCTQMHHECSRLLTSHNCCKALQRIAQLVVRRPQMLLKLTPYRMLRLALMQSAARTVDLGRARKSE
jgi:hypothetical protein